MYDDPILNACHSAATFFIKDYGFIYEHDELVNIAWIGLITTNLNSMDEKYLLRAAKYKLIDQLRKDFGKQKNSPRKAVRFSELDEYRRRRGFDADFSDNLIAPKPVGNPEYEYEIKEMREEYLRFVRKGGGWVRRRHLWSEKTMREFFDDLRRRH